MHKNFLAHLETILGKSIEKYTTVSGGDISNAHRLTTIKGNYFIKSSNRPQAQAMFKVEASGLQRIAATNTIAVPEIIAQGTFEDRSYLLLAFIESKQPSAKDFEIFGRQLAQMHLGSSTGYFGLETDNFIGSLPQRNTKHSDWAEFYVRERLVPQLQLAHEHELLSVKDIPEVETMLTKCKTFFGKVTPSLLHGDLWSGNYLIDTNGVPFLIDPAVYIGHSVVDLAMSKLFGGFGTSFYSAYHEIIPIHENQKALEDLYQLYYLLVHLNLFGSSYRKSVLRITQYYF